MKIYAATQNHRTFECWSNVIGSHPVVSVVESDTVAVDAEVIVMAGVWAFERYGGRPSFKCAQVIPNETGDEFPLWVVIPPHRPQSRVGGEIRVRDDFASVSPAYFAIFESVRGIRQEFGDEVDVVLSLPLLGMDDPEDYSTPGSVVRAVENALEGD